MTRAQVDRIGGLLLILSAAGLASGAASCTCEGPRADLDAVPSIPLPECARGEGELVVQRVLRSGPEMRDPNVVERFEIRSHGDCRTIQMSQEWPLGTSDVHAVFDAEGLPLRVWTMTTLPDARGRDSHRDLRVYDLVSAPQVLLARRGPNGVREGVAIRGPRPRAVIGPGRGLLTAWIQRADLEVGERLRESVLDVREPLALVRDVTLERQPDRQDHDLGHVRVYTIYGREPVYTDDDGVVVGDMFGLRRAEVVPGPIPDPMPDPGPIDPAEEP